MTGFTAPVSMVASKGAGGAVAAGVIGLLLLLALSARRDPTPATTANGTATGLTTNTGATLRG